MATEVTKKDVPTGFETPTALPQTPAQAGAWQAYNRAWWESHPMRYDWKEGLGIEDFSPQFYEEIDRRFFADAEDYFPAVRLPFDRLLPLDRLPDLDVLEIGVGSGSHAGLIASHARSFTGIDLTDYAVRSTSERMRLAGLNARILGMDAERMTFAPGSFDFIWSWGVIHHSADTRQVLSEMRRVLRPGGQAVVMVYYRNFWNYYVCAGLLNGLLRGMWFRTSSLHRILQLITDGGLARYYSIPEWSQLVEEFFLVDRIDIFGSRSHIIPLPSGRCKNFVIRWFPLGLSRFLNHRMRMGSFLVAHMTRKP